MSYTIKGTDDIFIDPIGTVSLCCKGRTKLNFRERSTQCQVCDKLCDLYVPETDEEMQQPEIQENGINIWQWNRKHPELGLRTL